MYRENFKIKVIITLLYIFRLGVVLMRSKKLTDNEKEKTDELVYKCQGKLRQMKYFSLKEVSWFAVNLLHHVVSRWRCFTWHS